MIKTIQTNRYYGHEPRIVHIFNEKMSDESPILFERFWEVYETWYEHADLVASGNSTFLVDNALSLEERLWKLERFGNYLYGALLSLYFSWESLDRARRQRHELGAESDLAAIRQLDSFVRYLFTALDALACCVFLSEGRPAAGLPLSEAEEKHLRWITFKSVKNRAGIQSGYAMIDALQQLAEFDYLSECRNLLTHRPFPRFHVDTQKRYHLPQSLSLLDSATQRDKDYLKEDVGSYLESCYSQFIGAVKELLQELNSRYRSRL